MDIEDFFSSESKSSQKESHEHIRLSVIDSMLVEPIIHGMSENYEIVRDNPLNCANRLVEGIVNSALITTLDYAKGKGSWKLIPDICVAAKGPFKTVNLFFNKEIRDLKTVAVNSIDTTATALLKIIMQEKYEIAPEFISIDGQLSDKLNQADAALLSGNEAYNLQQSNKIFIDLGDEWFDLTGLPFVYAVWVVHEMDFKQSMVDKIKSIVDNNLNNQKRILNSVFENNKKSIKNYPDFISNTIRYQFGLDEKEAITEFFRYAFFFGMIDNIPDLHFCD